ncbi:S9 family peptidase [Kordiimonas marina]|uniref:S9 family peptidase n=1 Tax=Kordiimonas marina TaxID=2872312 RepID=UPI001FF3D4AE|nr:S9 family peptidase [Kordiimonas marina]MCJ9430569.1 S9 family peptidase [Kordiimonas marina]
MLKAPATPQPPVATKKPHEVSHHGETVSDPYFWLKDPGYPEVTDEEILGYLRQENAYFESVMNSKKPVIDTIFEEIKGRVKEDDESVPWQDGAYEYRWAFQKGAQYRTWYRRSRGRNPFREGGWDVLLDENKEAEGLEFFKLGALEVSPDGKLMAFSADVNGSERFTVKVRNLETGELLADTVEEASGEVVWTADSGGFFYVHVSKEWRPYLVRYHALGAKADHDVYEEADTSFFVHIGETSRKRHLVIRSADHVTAENWILELDAPNEEPYLLAPRRTGHDYTVDEGEHSFYVRSNRARQNFSIYMVPFESEGEEEWAAILHGDDRHYLHGMQAFDGFLAVEERVDGLDQVKLLRLDGPDRYIEFPEPVYEVGLGTNTEFSQDHLRLGYSSLVTPPTVFDYDLKGQKLVVRKELEIPSGYDKSQYASERLMVTARDGVQVPVSLVYKKDWQKDTGAPLHLYGYGAYGLGMSPSFSVSRLSLMDRGFAYAIAHIRGGDELGYGWYEAGKLEHRTNTFNDFVDVARYLEAEGYAAEGGISISGGSAGGELMGAVVNQAPELFKGAVLHVPFVDVLNTMLDADLPLTPIEWPEWGNPLESADAFATIKSYCPYSNIEAKAYPPMMVTGGLNDPRVTYWEPAKWTAKLRAVKADDNMLVMKINMGAGHGGKSGRYERFHEVAEEYAFVLMCFGFA